MAVDALRGSVIEAASALLALIWGLLLLLNSSVGRPAMLVAPVILFAAMLHTVDGHCRLLLSADGLLLPQVTLVQAYPQLVLLPWAPMTVLRVLDSGGRRARMGSTTSDSSTLCPIGVQVAGKLLCSCNILSNVL